MVGKTFSVEVHPVVPERLSRLNELANDLYFSWNRGVRRLFRHLDAAAWESSDHNPKVFLRQVAQKRLELASHDPVLFAEYRRVLSVYDTYLEERPATSIGDYIDDQSGLIAYFSAEFGFHQSMPIYAGGLGILAADYCKAMSNLWVPFIGIGLLYRQGYFTQRILGGGAQIADYPFHDPSDLAVKPARDPRGELVNVDVEIQGQRVTLKVWEARAGHIRLYLLDSDVPENQPEDRLITAQLYGGGNDNRIKQEIVLGVGGVRAIRALGLSPSVWHINEGHSAFQIIERCREECAQGMAFDSALELVASKTVFTTHTPVPAGHDIFNEGMILHYFTHFIPLLGIDESAFLALGSNPRGGFNMTSLALRGSRFHNGVSRIHSKIASQMESYIWPQIPADDNPIGYVTNGVDVDTFLGASWVSVFDMLVGGGWRSKLTDSDYWQKFIDSLPDHVYLSSRRIEKADWLTYARSRLEIQLRRNGTPETIIGRVTRHLVPQSHDALVIGFARRFATYKRATLLFRNLERLERITNNPDFPVLIFFAGKAHPNDGPGQEFLKEVYRVSMLPQFQGKIFLLENYNLSMARELLPGVDVWLNTPEYPKEACGTSGMKAALNGAVNLSVLDGWWGEASDSANGWAIAPHPELDPETRDEVEATELLDILEHQVIPLYYHRNDNGEPTAWIKKSKASMKAVLPHFNSIRMALDYLRNYYGPAEEQGKRLSKDENAGANQLAVWKKKVENAWPDVSFRLSSAPPHAICSGEPIPLEVAVELNGLGPDDICVDCILGTNDSLGEFVASSSLSLTPVEPNSNGEWLYRTDLASDKQLNETGGTHNYKICMYPYNSLQSHRFEHGRMRWLGGNQ